MEYLDAELDGIWHQIRELDNQTARGGSLELTDEVRALLLRSASTVALSDVETRAALADVRSATALLRKIRERIREGSHRICDALVRMYELQDAGNIEGARQQMREVLAVEVVPHYREIAEGELAKLGDLR